MGITRDIHQRIIAIQESMVYDGENLSAAQYVPENIQPFQTPVWINFPISGARAAYADTFYEISRSWRLTLWVRKEGDGLRSENEFMLYDLADLTYETFVSRPRLELNGNGLNNVLSATLSGDAGPNVQPYPSQASDEELYYMIEFQLSIEYRSVCT